MEENYIFYDLISSENHRYYINKINENIFVDKEYFLKIKELYSKGKLDTLEMIKYNPLKTSKLVDDLYVNTNFESVLNNLVNNYNKKITKNKLDNAYKKLAEYDSTPQDILTELSGELLHSINNKFYKNAIETNILMFDYLEQIKGNSLNFGIEDLDKLVGGIQNNNLIVVSARASAGKTMFAVQTAILNAQKGKRVLYLSLEMSAEELALRIYSRISGINSKYINDNITKIGEYIPLYQKLNIRIDDKSQYIEDIISNIKYLKAKNEIDLVIVDYIGLIKTKGKSYSRENEVAKISREFKLLTKDYKIPIILLAQLNRYAEENEPTLSMLRESGALEQDANKVLFLYQEKEQKESAVGEIKVKVAKNREGEKGTITLSIDKRIGVIANYETN